MSIRNSPTYWIACLFTSIGYGRKRSSADVILASTQKAMVGLEDTLRFIKRGGNKVGDIWAVRLNSGKFGVNWERTKSVLEGCGMNLKVVNPAEKGSEGNLQGRLEGESTEQEHAGEEAGGIANVIGDGTLPIKTLKRKRGEHADTEAGGIANVFGDVAIPIRTLKRKRGT
ncbi:ADP-ribose 1''-phosphate phosphatase [Varicellaria rhodocarpa]|nr:ADP-ribose 1''-phosphate phosphatase [Varicellaria rhodocarpa]